MSSATADVSDVNSDQLPLEQTAELRAVIEKYTDQISWDPNDVGCLSDEFKEYIRTIPTLEGAKCKQRPYKLSYKELEAFETQVSLLLRQGIIKKADGLIYVFCRQCYSCESHESLRSCACVDFRRLNAVSIMTRLSCVAKYT